MDVGLKIGFNPAQAVILATYTGYVNAGYDVINRGLCFLYSRNLSNGGFRYINIL
jgi:hypothetical protein